MNVSLFLFFSLLLLQTTTNPMAKTLQSIILQSCQKSNTNLLGLKLSRAAFLVESTGYSMCLPFPASRSCSRSLIHGPFFTCKASMLQLSDYASVVTTPSDHSQGNKFLCFNDLCGHTEPTQIIFDNLLISRSLTLITPAKSLMLCKVTY